MEVERLTLKNSDFDRKGVKAYKGLVASTSRYDTGVERLTISNNLGEVDLLPTWGHQIWKATFLEQSLGMDSLVKIPQRTTDYLTNYGAFLLHCGPRRMGCPDIEAGDTHELHGTLPNALFGYNELKWGEDNQGPFISLEGNMRDRRRIDPSDGYRYNVRVVTTLHANSSVIDVSTRVKNNYAGPMELMVMEHVNFRLVPGSQLVYSAFCTPKNTYPRKKDPAHAHTLDKLSSLKEAMKTNPRAHDKVSDEPIYQDEFVVYLHGYLADTMGWAHSMQVMPDGHAHYVAHMPKQFPVVVRWMRTVPEPPDSFPVRSAMGLCLPATAEAGGYTDAKKKGMVIEVPFGGEWNSHIKAGLLNEQAVSTMRRTIDAIARTIIRERQIKNEI